MAGENELHSRLNLLQKDIDGKQNLSEADAEVAKLDADSLNEVITNVHDRWLSSIDKEEPESIIMQRFFPLDWLTNRRSEGIKTES